MKTLFSTNGNGKYRLALVSLFLLLLALSIGACSVVEDVPGLEFGKVDNVQIGMVESSGLNSTEARFHTLTGRKSWREHLQEGDTFILDYQAEI